MKRLLLIFGSIVTVTMACEEFTQRVTSQSGRISSHDSIFDVCKYTWVFDGLPAMDNMLLLNMTQRPQYEDNLVTIYDDNFMDSKNSPTCIILSPRKLLQGSNTAADLEKLAQLHKIYDGCKIRHGVSAPTTVTFVQSDIWKQHFAIDFRVIDDEVPSSTYEISTASTPVTTINLVMSTSAIPVEDDGFLTDQIRSFSTRMGYHSTLGVESTKSETLTSTSESPIAVAGLSPQMKTVVIVVGAIAFVLVALVVMMLLIMRRRAKQSGSPYRAEMRGNNLYESAGGDPNLRIYNEIPDNRIYDTAGDVTKEEVINPLYKEWDDEEGGKNSYEYIDIRPDVKEYSSHL